MFSYFAASDRTVVKRKLLHRLAKQGTNMLFSLRSDLAKDTRCNVTPED